VWRHERGTEKDSAKVNGWLVTSHSNVLFDAAIAGEGVARIPDLTILSHLRSGRLVPVLLDWETTDSPPINLLYRPSKGRAPRVRLLIEFVTELFRKLEAEREGDSVARPSAEKPYWYRRPYGRASAALSETK